MAKLSEKYEAVIVFSLKKDEEQIKALTAMFLRSDEWFVVGILR